MSLGVPHPQGLGSAPFRNPGKILYSIHYYYSYVFVTGYDKYWYQMEKWLVNLKLALKIRRQLYLKMKRVQLMRQLHLPVSLSFVTV